MFWSPNQASSSSLQAWWPKPETVDMVGIDIYVGPGATFANTYGDFYDAFAKKYNKPFVIGETGTKSGNVADKESWVKALASADLSAYPCFKSVSWFEYYKGYDFRVAVGQSDSVLKETMANFE
jgi:beta-mannanase